MDEGRHNQQIDANW